jgi:transcriptional regulator with XRE-family HTH domain
LTLKQVAERAHVTASFISQLERGKANPSLSTLKDIADLFGITIGALLDSTANKPNPCPVLRKGERKTLLAGENATFELLSQGSDLNCELVVNEYAPGASTGPPFTHRGFECGYVISGRLRVKLGDEAYFLRAGDSITFSSTIPHLIVNPTKKKAMTIWANSIPWIFQNR